MKASQWVRLFMLSCAVMSAVGVMAVMACPPASPASQSGSGDKESPTATPIPTATPYPDDCVEFQAAEDRMDVFCPEPGPRQIEEVLRKQYNALMAENELAAQEGRRSVLGPIMVEVFITTSTTDAVDDVVELLQDNGARVFSHNKGIDVHAAGRITALVNIELLPDIIAIEGVGDVVEVRKDPPVGSNLHVGPGTVTALERMFVDHWHEAGVTGAGVGVAVIDADFRDFGARILPILSQPVEFLCYDVGLNLGGCTNLPSGPVLRARRVIAWGDRKTGARARIYALYGRSVRAGARDFSVFKSKERATLFRASPWVCCHARFPIGLPISVPVPFLVQQKG